jgi:hypothetical protein
VHFYGTALKIPWFVPRQHFGHNSFPGSLRKMVTRTNLNVIECHRLKDFLLERLENGVLRRGLIRDGAVLVSVTHCTVSRLW